MPTAPTGAADIVGDAFDVGIEGLDKGVDAAGLPWTVNPRLLEEAAESKETARGGGGGGNVI
jgi:hypothetical protein